MTFLAPQFLWGLLGLLPLALIYFLKVRPRRKKTNTYFLWEAILQEKSASALFRKLRDVFSLLLMLLVFLALIISLARPRFAQEDERDVLLVLDLSPSMQAGTGENSTSFALAQRKGKEIVRALDGSKRLAVIGLSDHLNFASHLSDSPKDLLQALDSLHPTAQPPTSTSFQQLNDLANNENARVIFLTDGLGKAPELPKSIEIILTASKADNIGICSADLAWKMGQPGVATLFFRCISSFDTEQSVELLVSARESEQLLRLIPLNLTPGLNDPQQIDLENLSSGGLTLTLETQDALSEDNQLVLALEEPQKIPVNVLAAEPYFFSRTVDAFARGGDLYAAESDDAAAITLSDLANPETNRALILNPQTKKSPWWQDLGDPIPSPIATIPPSAENHPLLRHLEVENMNFNGARALTPPDNSLVLIASEDGVPLLYLANRDDRQAIVANLSPLEADFFLSPWFPVLVYDSARFLAGAEEALHSVYPTGTILKLTNTSTPPRWTAPAEKPVQTNTPRLNKPGFHQIEIDRENATSTRSFGVGLLNANESGLTDSKLSNTASATLGGTRLAWWLLLIGILLTTLESILYHRRKLG